MTASLLGPTALALGAGLALTALVGATTPWHALPPGVHAPDPRDFTEAERRRERAFHRPTRPLVYATRLVSTVVVLGLGFSPAGAWLVSGVGGLVGGGALGAAAAGAVVLLLARWVVRAPLSWGVHRQLRHVGLSAQGARGWLLDQLRGLALAALVWVGGLVGLVAAARAYPTSWWLWTGLWAALAVVAGSFGWPWLIEPLFNRFQSLPDPDISRRLLELARRDRVRVRRILVADASRRTTALNAYVSGIGRSRRIVVYDTLLAAAPVAELELVVAHELGHVRTRDVAVSTVAGALGVLAGAAMLDLAFSWRPLTRVAGVTGVADPASVALIAAVATTAMTLVAPAARAISRRVEARADLHALELTGDVATFIAVERRLALTNLADLAPGRLATLALSTHPGPAQRIALARTWAARTGAPR